MSKTFDKLIKALATLSKAELSDIVKQVETYKKTKKLDKKLKNTDTHKVKNAKNEANKITE